MKEGPYKTESTPRRIRGLLGGVYVFDTTKAVYVWEHGYCESSFFGGCAVLIIDSFGLQIHTSTSRDLGSKMVC